MKQPSITSFDIEIIKLFFSNFAIEMTPSLELELDNYTSSPDTYTYEDQLVLRLELAKAIQQSSHPLINEPAFASIRNNIVKILESDNGTT